MKFARETGLSVIVCSGDAAGKVWLEPDIELGYLKGFTNSEERAVQEIVKSYIEELKTKWNECFSK